MKKMWTIWFVVAALSGVMSACGSEETDSQVGSSQPDTGSGTFEPDTGDQADAGGQPGADTGADAGTPSRQSDASAPADGGTQTDSQGADAEQPTQGNDAGGTEQNSADSGTTAVPANADVVQVSGACQMKFSDLYANGANSGELRGSIPGVMSWDSGPAVSDSDDDGYLEYSPASLPTGTFDLSYLGGGNWALYGTETQLRAMSAAARAFVSCNWFDGANIVAVANPECHLRIKVEDGCLISGAGNMANLQ